MKLSTTFKLLSSTRCLNSSSAKGTIPAKSPNAKDKGPQAVIEKYKEKYPVLVVSDTADKEMREKWKDIKDYEGHGVFHRKE